MHSGSSNRARGSWPGWIALLGALHGRFIHVPMGAFSMARAEYPGAGLRLPQAFCAACGAQQSGADATTGARAEHPGACKAPCARGLRTAAAEAAEAALSLLFPCPLVQLSLSICLLLLSVSISLALTLSLSAFVCLTLRPRTQSTPALPRPPSERLPAPSDVPTAPVHRPRGAALAPALQDVSPCTPELPSVRHIGTGVSQVTFSRRRPDIPPRPPFGFAPWKRQRVDRRR